MEPDPDRYNGRMPYRRCGRSGLDLPAISLGLWQNFGGIDDFETGRAVLRRASDLGVTHFDLANNYGPPYGSAEENFGRWMAEDFRPFRDELIVSTKAGYDMWAGPYGDGGSRKYLLASLDQSLKRMGLDYVDIFYSHRVDSSTPLEETLRHVRALNDLAKERGQTLPQMAIAWVLRDKRVTTALIGARTVDQLEDSLAAVRHLDFSDDELGRIDQFATDAGIDIWTSSRVKEIA